MNDRSATTVTIALGPSSSSEHSEDAKDDQSLSKDMQKKDSVVHPKYPSPGPSPSSSSNSSTNRQSQTSSSDSADNIINSSGGGKYTSTIIACQ